MLLPIFGIFLGSAIIAINLPACLVGEPSAIFFCTVNAAFLVVNAGLLISVRY